MTGVTRVAIIANEPSGLIGDLAKLPQKLQIHEFRDLYEDVEELRRFRPQVLFFGGDDSTDEIAGALRLLNGLLPTMALILICPPEQEIALRPLASRNGGQILTENYHTAQLNAAFATAIQPASKASTENLIELARGLSDEINNPLMFVGGHVQLLRRLMEDDGSPERILAEIRSIEDGLANMTITMEKVRLLAMAGPSPSRVESLPITDILRDAIEIEGGGEIELGDLDHLEETQIAGDAELTRVALGHLCQFTRSLQHERGIAILEVSEDRQALEVRVTMTVEAQTIEEWMLPRSFEPYYLNRFLRGTGHGLSLFLIQAITHAHGGSAIARRHGKRGIIFELTWASV